MKKLQILVSIIMMLMMAGQVSAQCPAFNMFPGNGPTPEAMTDITADIVIEDWGSTTGATSASFNDRFPPSQEAADADLNCNVADISYQQLLGGLIQGDWQFIFYEQPVANAGEDFDFSINEAVMVLNTETSLSATNEIIVASFDETGVLARRKFTPPVDESFFAVDVAAKGGSVYILTQNFVDGQVGSQTGLIGLTRNGAVYTQDFSIAMYNEAHSEMPVTLRKNSDPDIDILYLQTYSSPGTSARIFAIDTTLADDADARAYSFLGAQAAEPRMEISDINSILLTFRAGSTIHTSLIPTDPVTGLFPFEEAWWYTATYTGEQFNEITAFTIDVVSEYFYIGTGCTQGGIQGSACLIAQDYNPVLMFASKSIGEIDAITIAPNLVEEDINGVVTAVNNANGLNLFAQDFEIGDSLWTANKPQVSNVYDLAMVNTPIGEFIGVGGTALGSAYFGLFEPAAGANAESVIYQGLDTIQRIGALVDTQKTILYANQIGSIIIYGYGNANVPEFSLTTLLLATLLAGGLVLFVVRRRK